MMHPRYLFKTKIYRIILTFILVLLSTCSMPPGSITQTQAPSNVWEEPAGRTKAKSDNSTLISKMKEPVALQDASHQGGSALLERHCANCHLVQWLQKVKKPRNEWEKILMQMERMGVRLEENERVDLLNYLTAADKP